jgi:hypothetical protein
MVCKKFQVYDWFRTLDGAKRIDFLNGMLHLCFPLELRFLGSCIEELARKDYSYLRDAEIKANTTQEIQLMNDICDKVTRSKMIVTLALLLSNNYDCARLLFDLLNVDMNELLDIKMKSLMDEKVADEFLLLLTMAANHPAFDFQMKTRMSQLYLCAEHKLKFNKIIPKESESDLCLCAHSESCSSSSSSSSDNNNIILNDENSNTENLNNIDVTIKNSNNDQDGKEIFDNNDQIDDEMVVVDKNNNNDLDDLKQQTKTNLLIQKESDHSKATSAQAKTEDELNVNNNDEELVKKDDTINKDMPFIESINLVSLHHIQGTENYKFKIKVCFCFILFT